MTFRHQGQSHTSDKSAILRSVYVRFMTPEEVDVREFLQALDAARGSRYRGAAGAMQASAD